MALVLADRVQETTTTTGTGTVTLLGAVTGFQSFAAIGNANTTYYTIAGQTGSEWEVGLGTYTSSGTTLSRTTVLGSSNAGSLVTFSAGTKNVFVTYPASQATLLTGTQTLTNKTLGSGLVGGASLITSGTVQTPASGTSVDFTSIPSWVKRITLNMASIGTNGTSGNLTLYLGTGATPTYTTSGYTGTSTTIRGSANTPTTADLNTGFQVSRLLAAGNITSGMYIITLMDAATNKWVCSMQAVRTDEPTVVLIAGFIALSATLTAVRFTTTTGVNSFTTGSVNILYE